MNIFIGTQEVANMIHLYAEGFKQLGHKVTTCAKPHPFYKNEYDYDLSLPRWLIFLTKFYRIKFLRNTVSKIIEKYEVHVKENIFEKVINDIDIFIFIFDGFTPKTLFDYNDIKSKNKKIVSLFCGTEVRDWDAFSKAYKINIETVEKNSIDCKQFNRKLFRLRKNELLSDAIYSLPDQSILGIRPYFEIKIPFIFNKYFPVINNRTIPKIVHIPSRFPTKGTVFIEKAIQELHRQNIQFEFTIHKGLSNSEVIKVLQDADILIDEVILFGTGTLGMEAIACGCALANNSKGINLLSEYICNINPTNMVEMLKPFILERKTRIQNINKSIEILKDHYNAKTVCNKILSDLEISPLDFTKHDFIPDYYINGYVLPEGHTVNVENKILTQKVIEKYKIPIDENNFNRMKSASLF